MGVASSDSEAAHKGPARVLGDMEGLGSRSDVGVTSSDSEAADNGPARVLGKMEGLGSRSAPLPPLPQSLSPLCVELPKEVHVATLF